MSSTSDTKANTGASMATADAKKAAADAKKAAAAKSKKVRKARDDAAARRFAALPEAKRDTLSGFLANYPGYQIIWPKGQWSTLRATDDAPEGSAAWMIMCNLHGTAKAIPSSKAAEAEGTKAALLAWCKGHKADAAKAARAAAKTETSADRKAAS